MSDDLAKLQSLRLKGRANVQMLAASWHLGEDEVQCQLEGLERGGLVEQKKGFYGLSSAGEERRQTALASEREQVDATLLTSLYDEFCALNGDFKQLVTDVQLGNTAQGAAPRQLSSLHERFAPVATRIGASVPRLAPYAARFQEALVAFNEGDARYLASPMVDSYHTLWFELHEELIQALGRTRADEAAAGRA